MHAEPVSVLRIVPLLPLLGAAVNLIAGARIQKRFGKGPVHAIAIASVIGSFAILAWQFLRMLGLPAEARTFVDEAWTLIQIEPIKIGFTFSVDQLSITLALVVSGVGSLIHIFSIGYMHEEPSTWRFFGYLNLFVAAMLTLTMADNMFVLFFGWEGVGLCSYLLIGFWYTNKDYAKAGMKAFVVNRIGDFGVLSGMLVLVWAWAGANVGPVTLSFRDLSRPEVIGALSNMEMMGFAVPTFAALLLFLGCTGKSAQLPLYVWLPDAMAGPTPVSALIHAATMVTAGVYLVARMHSLFALSHTAMTVVAVVGVLTALFAATIGLFQRDIKKVLAYSTVSQLGFMFVGVGVGAFASGFFHLVTHAFFKAALFLGAGSVILGMHHEQDLLKMGGLKKLMPRTWLAIAVGCWAIAGFPPFSGFFSKDEILWKALDNANTVIPGWMIYAVGLITAGCTAFYMYRLYYLAFTGELGSQPALATANAAPAPDAAHDASEHEPDTDAVETSEEGAAPPASEAHDAHVAHDAHGHDAHDAHGHGHHHTPHESPASMTVPLLILAGLAAVAGLLALPGMNVFEHWLEPVFAGSAPKLHSAHYPHALEYALMGVSVAVALIGFLIARRLYRNRTNPTPLRMQARFPRLYDVLFNKYYVDEIYDAVFIRPALAFMRVLAWIDAKIVDGAVNGAGAFVRFLAAMDGAFDKYVVDGAVNGVASLMQSMGGGLRRLQTGRVQQYILAASAGLVLILVFFNYVI